MKYIDQLSLSGKTVFIRADLNVPIEKDEATGKLTVADLTRVRATLPSVKYALDAGAKVVLASHLGRPKGGPDAKYSLKPVADCLASEFKLPVRFAPDCVGPEVKSLIAQLEPGHVLLLENLRFHPEEEKNDSAFAKQLAEGSDVYINDAFASSHRAHASVAGMVPFCKERAGGFTLKDELENFKKAFENPARPLAVIFGGSKVSSKLQAVKNVGPRADIVIIGGAMANTFLVAQGHSVGKSLVEPDLVGTAKDILDSLASKGVTVVLPTDVVVASELKEGVSTSICKANAIPQDVMALDIGPESRKAIDAELARAKTIIWNGPVGAFETPEFSAGTFELIDSIIASPAFSVVGGGDTDFALHQKHAFDKMGYVSTAGGAFLALLEGETLPGVAALQ